MLKKELLLIKLLIHPIYNIAEILDQYQPIFIIVYDLKLCETVHSVEEFYNRYYPKPLFVYTLVYEEENSFEMSMYNFTTSYEKNCWKRLIQNKGGLILPSFEEFVVNRYLNTPILIEQRKIEESNSLLDSRRRNILGMKPKKKRKNNNNSSFFINNKKKKKKKKKNNNYNNNNSKKIIVVDSREFRSDLPFSLHEFGFEVLPRTLETGDYILSSNLVIERKSIPDLTQSLASSEKGGRLLSQVRRMGNQFKKIALLIEFDDRLYYCSLFSGGGSSNDHNSLRKPIGLGHVAVKLYILIKSFPDLKVLWSRGSEDTAKLFKILKDNESKYNNDNNNNDLEWFCNNNQKNNNEGSDSLENESNYQDMAVDILRKLPGVNDDNYRRIMENIENLQELCKLSKSELQKLIGSKSGALLFDFLVKGEK